MSTKSNRFAGMVNQMVSQRETTDGPPAEIIPGDEAALSQSEGVALSYYEQVIERGLRAFLEAGAALLVINRHRLYRVSHGDFYTYCEDRWGIQKSQAYRLMDACEVVNNLSPIGDTLPANEAQARPLAKLKDPEQQRQAWQTALQRAQDTGRRITADLVAAVVSELHPPELPASPAPELPQNAPQTVHGEAEATSPEPIPDPVPEPPQNAAHKAVGGDWLDADDADEKIRIPPPIDGWADDMEQLHPQLTFQGYQLQAETDSRLTYRHRVIDSVVRVVRPPEPGKVKVRVVVHKDDDWADVAERLARVGVELDHPRSGHLPRYPETQRAYGMLDLSAQQPDAVAGLHAKLSKARDREQQIMSILHEYQEHITRAQNYKPTSDRGEAVSPFLRLVERLWLELQEEARKEQ